MSYDVAIVGGGHNGLVTAFYLARAGMKTVVLERRDFVGGCCVTEEFAPGFHASTGAYVRRTGDDAGALLETWAVDVGARAGARVGAPYQVGWCSWYHYFHDVDERALRTNLSVAGEWPFEVFQLDDGYQAEIGDWLETNERFPSGVSGAADAIAAAGFVPGLWLAPFLASPTSRLAREHPEWFARDERDAPLVTMFHEKWGGAMWQLDVTRPDVLEHLRATAAALRELGYRYLKLDFTFSSTGPGRYADATRTPAQRLRAGYDAVRAGLGFG